jgi:Resolvase, N terminal domain
VTNPEHQQSEAQRRGCPTADKGALRCIRISSLGERSGPEHHTLAIQRASIERTGRNHGYELVDVLSDENQSGRSRNWPQFGMAMQRILASEADAIIVSKAGRSAKAPWRNSLHTDPGGVVQCHRWPLTGNRSSPTWHPYDRRTAVPLSKDLIDARDLIHVIDSRTEKLDEHAEPPRHALASLTSANDPHGPGDGETVGASGAWIGVAVC